MSQADETPGESLISFFINEAHYTNANGEFNRAVKKFSPVSGQSSVVSGPLSVDSSEAPGRIQANVNPKQKGRPMKTAFENLRVYRLSEKLADEIWDLVLTWDHFAKDTVGRQLVRSGDSIGANIAEGSGRGSYQDNRRFVRTA